MSLDECVMGREGGDGGKREESKINNEFLFRSKRNIKREVI